MQCSRSDLVIFSLQATRSRFVGSYSQLRQLRTSTRNALLPAGGVVHLSPLNGERWQLAVELYTANLPANNGSEESMYITTEQFNLQNDYNKITKAH